MRINKHELGKLGEIEVLRKVSCPKCKRNNTLRRLPPNFKCADIICDFCGYLAQVKTASVANVNSIPSKILGGAWAPQEERMKSGIYFPLFLVLVNKRALAEKAIYYLPADLQNQEMFKPRKPLSPKARRAGWQGFTYDPKNAKGCFHLNNQN